MNGSIRVSAKTVDDAITEALIQLGVTSDRLEYEVIEKGSAGFLGIGMKQAVIEARRKPEPKEEKVEEPVVEEPVRVEPKKVEAVQPQKAAAEKKADEPQKAAFEKAVEKEVKEFVHDGKQYDLHSDAYDFEGLDLVYIRIWLREEILE